MVFCAEVVNMTTLIGAKGAHKHVKHIFTKDFEGSRGPRGIQPTLQVSEPDHFEVISAAVWGQCGYLWVTLYHLMVTLQCMWSRFGYIKVHFKKHSFSQLILMIL